jgi:hypothetical protein
MRAFDFVIITLIVLLGVWCLVLQVRSPASRQPAGPGAAGEAASAAQALEGRVQQLESSLKAVKDRQAQVVSNVAGLADATERSAGREATAAQPPALSKDDVERMIDAGVKKYVGAPRGEASGPLREVMREPAGKPDERLDRWVSDTVTALGLQTQDEGILKEIVQERNRKLSEELLRDPDTPPEAKFRKVFTGDFFKSVDDEMCDSLKRYYKDETLDAFRKHYNQNPPPLVIRSPEDESVTVIHAAAGRVRVNKTASGPPPGPQEEDR